MIYYQLFAIISSLSFFFNFSKKRGIIVVLIIVVLSVFAGTRLSIDRDYPMYYNLIRFLNNTSFKDYINKEISTEITMYLIPKFYYFILNTKEQAIYATFLTYAFLGVSTKIIAIEKYSNYFFLSIILYVSNLFLMMEMTTIRAGVAAGIFLLSLKDLKESNDKGFFVKFIFCFLFHSSSVLFLIPWLVLKFKTQIKYFYIAIAMSFFSAILKINMIKVLFLDRIFPRVEVYLKMMEWQKNEGTNIFSFRSLIALSMLVIFAVNYKKLKEKYAYFDMLFKIHIISISIFFLLSTSSEVFSLRSFELFSVCQIILYPMIVGVFTKKTQLLGWVIILFIALIQIVYLVDIADIYRPYKSWFL